MPSTNKIFGAISLIGFLSLAGCADYMNNRDSITLGAGDASQANIGIHTVKPFPRPAGNTNISISGEKSTQAYIRYLEPCDPDIVTCTGSSGGSQVPAN